MIKRNLLLLGVFIIVICIYYFFGLRVFVVVSDSMNPAVSKGSLILVHKKSSYSIGEIITYASVELNGKYVTHRIQELKTLAGNKLYVTKGDANNYTDKELITSEAISGAVVLKVPGLGSYLAQLFKYKVPYYLFYFFAGLHIAISFKQLKQPSSHSKIY